MTRVLTLVLALCLSVPAHGDELEPGAGDVPRDVKSAVALDDAQLGAGVWASRSRAAWMAAQQKSCTDDKRQLQDALEKKPLQPPETNGKIIAAATIAGGGGVIVGIAIALVGLIATGHIK